MRIKNLLFLVGLTCIVFLAISVLSPDSGRSFTKIESPEHNSLGLTSQWNKQVQPPKIAQE
jgi:hypothetical protein